MTAYKKVKLKNLDIYIYISTDWAIRPWVQLALRVRVVLNPVSTSEGCGVVRRIPSHPLKLFYTAQKLAKQVNRSFVTFSKIFLPKFIKPFFWKILHHWAPQGSTVSSWYFQKLGKFIYHWKVFSSLISKNGTKNSNYLI